MTTLELYTKGTKVWIPHREKVWEGAELLEEYDPTKGTLAVLTDENERKNLAVKSEKDLPFLRNPAILVGENDLTSLSYLHEPAVLHNLRVRFCENKYIYTYCGIVLVAINPYNDLPIYDVDTIQTYRGRAMGDLDPHIFAVAEEAYTELERGQRDQSIIVSGESGAGKTVSAKYTMRYFAMVGGNDTETQVERRVLASSPIMEAIGNAKTTRNDNSSRFGKFIELHFDKQFHINGASMRTYLLEKSRVVFQSPEERNYHIFYQICAARSQLPHLSLDHQDNFHYLSQGQSADVIGVDDAKGFEETVEALNILRFSEKELDDMLKILASILHLGNVKFIECVIEMENEQNQEGCTIENEDQHMKKLSDLLEIDEDEMRMWLCTRKLVSMRDVFMKPMTVKEAESARDALAKHIYAELFNWIVLVINKELESDSSRHKFIGVLDIYGFETFNINSFEQFCINYANEKLQQQFNLHVFKLEQDEYIREGIAWKMIDFYDNQPCIDLIETRLGILDLLDEECKMPKGSDGTWTEKLYLKCSKFSHFSKGRFGSSSFVINHFADKVQYESPGFLDKNRDTVIEEQINIIKVSKNNLVKRLFASKTQKLAPSGKKVKITPAQPLVQTQKTHKKSVGSQFRDSLNKLMITLNATTPHYVRCIKPNDSKEAFEYNPQRAVQQLRACGVLETIRISAAGFPGRWTFGDFFCRYRVLCLFKDINRENISQTCQNILVKCIKNPDKYQFGRTKIFFRAGQVAYLEKLRSDKLKLCCIIIQKTIRAFIYRKRYLKIKKSAGLLQRYGRGLLARRLAEDLRRKRAAITIQRYVRGWLQRKNYKCIKTCILGIQTHARGYMARLYFLNLKYNAKATIIQKHVRGWLARREYRKRLKQIVICQAAVRRFLARKLYKKLRIEARSIEHVKNLNKGLENKIISLQQRIDEVVKSNNELKVYQHDVQELKTKMTKFKAMEIEIKNLNNLLIEKNKVISKLEEEIRTEKEEKIDLIHEQEKYYQETENQRLLWKQETDILRKELDELNEIVKMNEKGAEENLMTKIKEETKIIRSEADNERESYQRLLNDYMTLEQRCEELDRQLNAQNYIGTHKRSISDVSSISGLDEQNFNNEQTTEDHGYGSVRSTAGNNSHARQKLEHIDWRVGEAASGSQTPNTSGNIETRHDTETSKVEIGLVLKLQHKLAEVERERERMQKRLDEIDMSPKMERVKNEAELSIKISELELCNSQLKTQLYELQDSVNEGTGLAKLHEQLVNVREELDRKSEEIVQLKSVLANQAHNMKSILNAKTRTGEYINEDGELAQAYETQKTINKQLELELQDEKAKYKAHEREYKFEIEKLREDNERQQRILSANLTSNPQSQSEAYMQHEITRMTQENLQLIDKNDILGEQVKKLKRQLKILAKKLGADIHSDTLKDEYSPVSSTPSRSKPNLRKKSREYLGMFIVRNGDENTVMSKLVIDLDPRTAVSLLPALPAFIIFMCLRHADYLNDEDKVKTILSTFLNCVKKVVRRNSEDFKTTALWLSNILKLLNIMKQYSGEEVFQKNNTAKQNEQCLRNFDLSDYRTVCSDTAYWIYQEMFKVLEKKIHSLIVPAILEYEEVSGMHSQKPETNYTKALCRELTSYYKILLYFGVDPDVVSLIFKQLFYFMCASSLNNLLLRKELCNWSKGFQIRHNLSHLEMWTREGSLDEAGIKSMLQPIIQAAQLLQARKSDEDVSSVCEMCSALTTMQICKILNLYTPTEECEERVSPTFIRKVQEKLEERGEIQGQQTLLMDTKYKFGIRFPFNASDICLEDIEIPEVLNLPMIEKI